MNSIFGSPGGVFTPQKPQLNLNLSGTGGGTGLFSQKPTGTTGLGGTTAFTGLGAPTGRGGGLGGLAGAGAGGGLGGFGGGGSLGGMSQFGGTGVGSAGLGGGTGGLGGMSQFGGTGVGSAGLGGGTGGLGGMSQFGGTGVGSAGLGGGLGGMSQFGGTGVGSAGLGGGLGGTAGSVGGLTGLGRGTAGTGLGGGLWASQGQGGVGSGMGLSGGLGGLGGGSTGLARGVGGATGLGGLGASGTSGLFAPKPQTGGFLNPGMSGGQLGANRPQTHEEQMQLTAMALSSPTIFGDERDTVITKLNQLQVYWGFGKGICNSMGIVVDFTENNPFSVMKSVGYLRLPTNEDKEGLVRIVVNKPESELNAQKANISNTLRQIINEQTVNPIIDSIYGIIETKLSEIRFYLLDGNKNRISARQVVAFFSTNEMTNKLRNMGVQELHPCLRPSESAIKAYLEKTPQGFDSNVWSQAVKNNPNPKELVPVPILGFQALRARALAQKSQSEQHESRLRLIGNEIANLHQSQTNIVSKFEQAKRKQLELNHRILKVMVQQEISRKAGHTIQEDEEILRIQFESILSELTSPSGVKSELTEVTSLMRLNIINSKEDNYKLEEDVVVGIQMHLSDQQERIENLLKVITEDMEDLRVIQEAFVDGSL